MHPHLISICLILLLLAQGGGRVETAYDSYRDKTVISVSLKEILAAREGLPHRLTLTCDYEYNGREYARPAEVRCSFLRVGEKALFTDRAEVVILADGERHRFAGRRVVTTLRTTRTYLAEVISFSLATEDFKRLVEAGTFEYLISSQGETKGRLTPAQIGSLKALSETIR